MNVYMKRLTPVKIGNLVSKKLQKIKGQWQKGLLVVKIS